jgi:uncharacterized membrane protein
MPEKITQEQKIWGAVSYLWILSLVALAARKDDEFIRFHANQGILLFVISVILMFVPFIGWAINILVTIVAIIALINALQGEKWELPVIGVSAKKLGDWIIKTIKI